MAHDLPHLATVLADAFPDIEPVAPLALLGEGFRSTAVETESGMVVRVGKTAEALQGYKMEQRVLPFLHDRLDTPIPRAGWFAPPREDLPYGAHAYPRLRGVNPRFGVPVSDSVAGDLGRFLAQLHALPVSEAAAAGAPTVDSRARLLGAKPVVMPVLESRLAPDERDRLNEWWREFEADERMHTYTPTVCHHDLWHDNLLIGGEGHLTGVLDWSHAEIGDPANDFSAPRYFGDRFFGLLLIAYRAADGQFDAAEGHRSLRFWEGRELGGIAWAIENNDPVELEEGIRKLRRGPLLHR